LIAFLLRGPARRLVRTLPVTLAEAAGRALEADPQAAIAMVRRLENLGAQPLLVAGDSHSRLHARATRRGGRWLLVILHAATGASAAGLANPQSRSGEGERLARLLAQARAGGLRAPVLLVFGQVDVEFVFTFKRLRSDPPAALDKAAFRRFCRETAQAYADFAASLTGPGPVTLASILPPALSDEAWRAGYLNAHLGSEHGELPLPVLAERLQRAEIASRGARTADHRRFDAALRRAASARGLGFLDVARELPIQEGAAHPALLGPPAGRDHHLDYPATDPYITPVLWRFAESVATH
jgi:hypothetical protein